MRGPCGHRTGPARKSSMFFISYGTRKGPVRDPQGCRTAALGTRKGIDTRIGKTPARASYLAVRGPYGPLQAPQGLFTGCLQYLNPYGARKLIMYALKLYGDAKIIRHHTGPVRAPLVDVRFLFITAREQHVRGPGERCDWGIIDA